MKNKVYMLLNRHIALITTIVDLLYIGLLFFSSCASLTSPATLNCFLIVLTIVLGVFLIIALMCPFWGIANFRKICPKRNKERLYILSSLIFLICVIFAILYAFVIMFDERAFQFNNGLSRNVIIRGFDLLYFSIVTFTTLGYGDIVPVSWPAKVVVSVEALSFTVGIAFVLANFYFNKNEGDCTIE